MEAGRFPIVDWDFPPFDGDANTPRGEWESIETTSQLSGSTADSFVRAACLYCGYSHAASESGHNDVQTRRVFNSYDDASNTS
jgi:hypothetical protein